MADAQLVIDVVTNGAEKINQLGDDFASLKGKLEATFALLTEGVKQFAELAAQGDRYGDVMSNLTTDIEEANDALNGQVDRMTLAMAANKASQAGLDLTANQFRALTVRAKEYADANGMEFEPAMQKLVQVLVRGSDRMKAFGLEAQGTEGMLRELTAEYGNQTVAIGGVTGGLDALGSQWTNLKNAIGQSIDSNGPFTQAVSMLAGMATWLAESKSAATGLGEAFTLFTLGPVVQLIAKMKELRDSTPSWLPTLALVGGPAGGLVDVALRLRGGPAAPSAVPQEGGGGYHVSSQPNAVGGAAPPTPPRPRGGGNRSAAAARPDMDTLGMFLYGPGSTDDREQYNSETGGLPFLTSEIDTQVAAATKGYTTIEQKDSWWTDRNVANAERRRVAAEKERQELDNVVDSYVNAATQAGLAAALSGKSAEGVARAAIAALAMQAGTEAIMQTAAGIADTARFIGSYGMDAAAGTAATTHFTSAAVYGGIALGSVAVGKGAFGSSFGHASNGGGGASGTSGRFAGTSGGGSSGGRTTNITINMGPGLSSSRDVRKAVVDALVLEADNGHPLPYRVVQQRH